MDEVGFSEGRSEKRRRKKARHARCAFGRCFLFFGVVRDSD